MEGVAIPSDDRSPRHYTALTLVGEDFSEILARGIHHKVAQNRGFIRTGAPCVSSRGVRPPQLTDAENKRSVAHDAGVLVLGQVGKAGKPAIEIAEASFGSLMLYYCYTAVTNSNKD